MILNFKRVSSRRNLVPTLGRLINAPLLLIIFFDFFLPISFQPLPSPTINYWGKFSTQIYLLKQYTHADFFAISQRSVLFCKFVQGSQHFVFCFVRNQLIDNHWPYFAEVIECLLCFHWMCCLILLMNLMCFANHLNSLLLIYLTLISKRIHLIQRNVVLKGWLQLKTLQLLCILY